jgi:hypothetical protein
MCNLTRSIPASCGKSVPGVRKIWLARKANAVTYTYANDDFSYISFILNSAGNPTPYYEFEGDLDFNASLEELDQTANGRSFPQSFTLRFAEMAKEKRSVLESMIYDQLSCVYLDRNGRYWLLGQENGLKATGLPRNIRYRRRWESVRCYFDRPRTVPATRSERHQFHLHVSQWWARSNQRHAMDKESWWQWAEWGHYHDPEYVGGFLLEFPRMPLSQLGNQPLIELMQ